MIILTRLIYLWQLLMPSATSPMSVQIYGVLKLHEHILIATPILDELGNIVAPTNQYQRTSCAIDITKYRTSI
ncbi:hypothetical protein BDU57DRAFT_515820 [Ampelomyces quisqualis]|uniref:Secreted protein n=1 Tax=Ampelomyces quisqualis TaxID=50730 RepID=A0A6A5QKU5_AMPQU|nr:hypothetical protein BDU57DRAFT_515820 [Ampelomyces quisqualis]